MKKYETLAEMWRELSEYQEQADRDGHGESWARMCEERTRQSSLTAYAYASTDAEEAALAAARAIHANDAEFRAARAADAEREAESAIAAIRRAKEGK